MKSDLSSSKRLAPFLSLLALLVALTVLVLFLSRQILGDIALGANALDNALVPMVLVLPLTLLGAVAYQGFLLWRDSRANKAGTRLKIRITLFFLITALLASVPQGVLSLSFIDTAMKTWVNQKWGDALKGGLNTALEYHYERIQELRNTAESPFIPEITRRALKTGDNLALARGLADSNLRPSALQVFSRTGQELLQVGPASTRLQSSANLPLQDGPLPKQTTGTSSILRQLRHVEVNGQTYAVVVSQILPPGFEEASRKLTESLEKFQQLQQYNDTFRTLLFVFYFLFALPILLIAGLISFTQSDDLIRPLLHLENATRRIAAGDFSTRLLTPERDELAFLAESFNTMTAELASSRSKIQQTEKVSAWQEIARQLAHELRNPLTPIRLSAERILRRSQSDPQRLPEIVEPAVQAIITEVVRLDALLKEFAGFARLPAPQKSIVTLHPILLEILHTYQAAHPDLQVNADGLAPDTRILADAQQMEQVFTNLIKNSVEAMDGSGKITLISNLVKKGNTAYCRIQLHDTGPGIDPALRETIFQPYVTTKAEGTGLGLAIVERILFDHQGRVWFESQAGYGTTFFLDLPIEESVLGAKSP